MSTKKISFLILLTTSFASYGQSFLNGDFEINSAVSDLINITNSQYDSVMTNSSAFGNLNGGGATGGDMDVITSTNYCGFAAQHGNWYVCLTGGGTDAISLKLSDTLIAGHLYEMTFYDRYGSPPATTVHPFLIGVSNVDTTFGTLVYTAPNAATCFWSLRSFTFIAPVNGQYITVKISAGSASDTWCHIDNFTIGEPLSAQGIDHDSYFQVSPNPASNEINIKQYGNYHQLKSVRILNPVGKEFFKSTFADKIDVSRFANGLYILEIVTDNKTYYTKFLKQ